MTLRTLPLAALTPAPYNPRKPLRPGSPRYKRLARSIDEFDLVQPIVWNERTGHVVAGHQRLAILRDKGVTETRCVVVNLPLEKEKALNVALNNAAVGSDWDDARLHDLLLTPPTDPPSPSPADDHTSDPTIQVTLLIPEPAFEHIRPTLDHLAAEHHIKLHIHHQ